MGFLDSLKSLFGGGQKEEGTDQAAGDQSTNNTASATEETAETTPEEPEKTEGSV